MKTFTIRRRSDIYKELDDITGLDITDACRKAGINVNTVIWEEVKIAQLSSPPSNVAVINALFGGTNQWDY